MAGKCIFIYVCDSLVFRENVFFLRKVWQGNIRASVEMGWTVGKGFEGITRTLRALILREVYP
jgi:hypothetical protein